MVTEHVERRCASALEFATRRSTLPKSLPSLAFGRATGGPDDGLGSIGDAPEKYFSNASLGWSEDGLVVAEG